MAFPQHWNPSSSEQLSVPLSICQPDKCQYQGAQPPLVAEHVPWLQPTIDYSRFFSPGFQPPPVMKHWDPLLPFYQPPPITQHWSAPLPDQLPLAMEYLDTLPSVCQPPPVQYLGALLSEPQPPQVQYLDTLPSAHPPLLVTHILLPVLETPPSIPLSMSSPGAIQIVQYIPATSSMWMHPNTYHRQVQDEHADVLFAGDEFLQAAINSSLFCPPAPSKFTSDPDSRDWMVLVCNEVNQINETFKSQPPLKDDDATRKRIFLPVINFSKQL
ncbi:hypothetical protein BDZ97DRAFT_1923728 [Flammula alnicola]|nr:hypothetical protein BDZ97DRAFT_1923728 [Flammula alnicola]